MADMNQMKKIVDAHGGWDNMSQDLYDALSDLKKNNYDWNSISDKSYSVLDTANNTANKVAPSQPAPQPKGYKYPSNTAYNDLRVNVGEVGYSGLDPEQKKLFQAQFPQSKFAKAGGSFEDAVKYVDSQARQSRPISASEFAPMGGMMGAPIPMTPIGNTPATKFVEEKPFTSAGIGASTLLPFSWPGILAATGLGAGTSLADEKLVAKEKSNEPIQDAIVSGLVSGLTHGIGGTIANRLSAFASKYLTPAREYPNAVAKIEAENAKELLAHEARQSIAARIDNEANKMASEYVQPVTEEQVLAELPNGLKGLPVKDARRIAAERSRTYEDADELAGLHKLDATKKAMWLAENGPMDVRWKQFGGAGTISDEAAEAYYNMTHAPFIPKELPVRPSGVDLVRVINPFPSMRERIVGGALPESIRNAQWIRNGLWPAEIAEVSASPLAQGIKALTYPTGEVAKDLPEGYRRLKKWGHETSEDVNTMQKVIEAYRK